MSRTDAFLSQVETHLFSSLEELEAARISEAQRGRLMRLREAYFFWRDHPRSSEREVVQLLQTRFGLGHTAAYDDLHLLRRVVGKMTLAPQDYHRWVFLSRFEEAWELAKEKEDARALGSLLSAYGKYNRLDAAPDGASPYADIVPPFLDITADASVAGFTPVKNAREVAARLARQYARDIEAAEAVELSEVTPLAPPLSSTSSTP